MAKPAEVEIVGLKALTRDLVRSADPRASEVLKYLQVAGRLAAGPVADQYRSSAPSHTGRMVGTTRITSARSGATVRVGNKAVPYAGWVDFGGGHEHESRQYIKNGRYLFPAAHTFGPAAARLYSEAIQTAYDHFSWTNTGTTPEAIHD